MFNPSIYANMMGQAAQGMAGAGQANPTSNPMANFGGLGAMNPAGLAAMAGMGAGMPQQANAAQASAASSAPASSAAFSNPSLAAAMAQNPAAMQQMQAMYQNYALRIAAYQRMLAGMGGAAPGAMPGAPTASMPGAMPGAMQGMGGMPGGMGMPGMAGMVGMPGMPGAMHGMAGAMPGGMGGGMGGMMGMPQRPMQPGMMHGMPPPQPPQQPPGGQRQGNNGEAALFYKTRLCQKWKEGKCPNGPSCKYAHGESDLRPSAPTQGNRAGAVGGQGAGSMGAMGGMGGAVNRNAASSAPKGTDQMRKTRLCEEFMRSNACRYGDKCTFAHGAHELRQAGPALAPTTTGPNREVHKTRLCERFMQTGQCNYGDKCTFAHGHHELKGKPPGASSQQAAAGTSAAAGRPAGGFIMRPNAPPPAAAAPGSKRSREDEDGEGEGEEGAKRVREDTENGLVEEYDAAAGNDGNDAGGDGVHMASEAAEEEPESEPACEHCANLAKAGKQKLFQDIQALSSPALQKVGVIILGMSPQLDLLWHKLQPSTLLGLMDKLESIGDRVALLRTLHFHSHLTEEQREELGSQSYVAQGLPPVVADFLYVCMVGRENTASMQEYFEVLEVCKQQYGVKDDQEYLTYSSTIANVMLG